MKKLLALVAVLLFTLPVLAQMPLNGSMALPVANAGVTGTTINTLSKLSGAPSVAVIAATTDTKGIIGICAAGCGTSGTAYVARFGLQNCVFDGATTAGDYVQISTTTAGNCHDSGAAYPTSGQVIGRVLSTNGTGGTYLIDLFGPGIVPTSGGSGVGTLFVGSSSGGTTLPASTTDYMNTSTTSLQSGEGNRSEILPVACTARNFWVRFSGTQSADGALTACLRQNGTTTTPLCVSVAASASGSVQSDTTDTFSYSAGDRWSIQFVNAGSGTSATINEYGFQCN